MNIDSDIWLYFLKGAPKHISAVVEVLAWLKKLGEGQGYTGKASSGGHTPVEDVPEIIIAHVRLLATSNSSVVETKN